MRRPRGHLLSQLRVVPADQGQAGGGSRDQHLHGRHPLLPIDSGDQSLAGGAHQRTDQRQAHLVLRFGREARHQPAQGLAHVSGQHPGQDQAPRLGGAEGHLGRRRAVEAVDDYDVGVVAQGGGHPPGDAGDIAADLALADGGHAVPVQDLDGVLHGHDVAGPGVVEVVHEGGHGHGAAGAGRTGDQHQAPFGLGQPAQPGR